METHIFSSLALCRLTPAKVATSPPPVATQPFQNMSSVQHIPRRSVPTQILSHSLPPMHEAEKPGNAVRTNIVNVGQSECDKIRRVYVPTALRTSLLVSFCGVILLVCALLQVAAAASLGAQGLESLAVYSPPTRRGAVPQSSDPACPPGATCAPAPGSWSNPDSLETLPPVTAPPPGSWTKPNSLYFLGAYVPTLMAILLSIWWKCIFARLKEMEPYYQLARSGGAEAEDSLMLSYSTGMLPAVLVKSFRSKHWPTFTGAFNMVLITLCTLFAAEALHLTGVGKGCGVIVNAKGDFNDDCDMELAMEPAMGFLLGAILIAVFVATSQLLIRLYGRQTGLSAEATSIVGVASLSDAIVVQTSPWGPQPSPYRFAISASTTNGTREGTAMLPATQPAILQTLQASRGTASHSRNHYPREMRIVSLSLFFLYQVAVLVLVVYYSFISKPGTNNALEDFMDSDDFGVRLFMTVVGLGIKFYWGWIERYVRHVSPLIAMAAPNGATAQKSVLMPLHSHPITALFSRNTWSNGLLGLVTLMASLTELLVVLLNTIPFSTATSYNAWRASVFMSIVVLIPMILTTPAVILWSRKVKGNSVVADIPESIADVLGMVQDTDIWASLEGLPSKERIKAVNSWHAKFATRKVGDRWQIAVIR